MKKTTRAWRRCLPVFLVIPALCTIGFAQHHHAASEFASAMDAGMKKMMKDMESAPMTGDPDRDFLSMMVPHHEGAVEMARLVLIHGRDPMVRRLAEEIIVSQTTEIRAMKGRLSVLSKKSDPDPDGFPALGGTRGEGKK